MSPPLRCFLSARDGAARLSEQPPVHAAAEPGLPRLWVDARRRFQALEGFGGAFTEAAATTWLALGEAQRAAFLRDCFDPVHGHGYTLCRVHMNSCDFALGNYAHVETPGDFDLAGFDIGRDRRALLPMIRAAQAAAGRPLKLLVSPWSPPAWMETNGRMNDGGRLRPECRLAWARCFVRFIEAYAAEGVPVWGVSVQNEPEAHQRWDSCLYSAEEERDFVRDFLGPELAAAGLGHVRIVVWDHNRDVMVERASVIYGDAEAARYIWGTGFHWYGEDHFDHVQLVHDAWPDKQLLFTEGCQEGGPHHGSWDLGERYARSIINDLNRWTVGWIDWNLLLDEHGGPNHVGNFCSAPVLARTAHDELLHQSSYWYLGHFSRFIKPGARRLLCAATRQAIEATAFANPDGSIAVVAMNRGEQALRFELNVGGTGRAVELPPRAIATWLAAAGG
ncbi:MAG: glucosylceramidase [Leptothrix sp. (in: Bacteria)]|nr:glucosylceramidase [Leptothrix sp. (in: b-proteobacteria)]